MFESCLKIILARLKQNPSSVVAPSYSSISYNWEQTSNFKKDFNKFVEEGEALYESIVKEKSEERVDVLLTSMKVFMNDLGL